MSPKTKKRKPTAKRSKSPPAIRQVIEPAPVGRPTSYREEYAATAKAMTEAGSTLHEVAIHLGACIATLYHWGRAHPEFLAALKVGRATADERVVASLYQRATGYSHHAVKIQVVEGEVVETPYVEHFPPDTGAAMAWLKNRRPEEWKDRREADLSGSVTIRVVGGLPESNPDTPLPPPKVDVTETGE